MFKKYNWKQPLYKNDVISVIIFGLSAAILGGILSGLIEALLTNGLNLYISFGLLFNSLIVGFAVKKAYAEYHILYPVLALVFFLLALFFNQVAYFVGVLGIQNFGLAMSLIFYNFPLPLYCLFYMTNVLKGFDVAYFIFLIINLVFYVLGFVATYRIAKGKHR